MRIKAPALIERGAICTWPLAKAPCNSYSADVALHCRRLRAAIISLLHSMRLCGIMPPLNCAKMEVKGESDLHRCVQIVTFLLGWTRAVLEAFARSVARLEQLVKRHIYSTVRYNFMYRHRRMSDFAHIVRNLLCLVMI